MKNFILFIPGVSKSGLHKQWKPDLFAQLAMHFENKGYKICVIGTKIDYPSIKPILKECKFVINKIDQSPPEVVYTIAKYSHLIISNDTGPGHIAALSNTSILWLGLNNSISKSKPRKTEYRKFNVKTVSGIDDFAAMREVVYRRYKRLKEEEKPYPDLILIDGGKGQLSMAVSALRELGLDYIPVVGLAKRLEEVFVPGNPEAQSIHKQSPGLILLRRIRDEAHRFAITFQRQKRNKDMVLSIFSEIPGMGKKRLEKLLLTFDNLESIAKLTPEVINGETGIPLKVCEEIQKVASAFLKSQNKP